MTSVFEIQSEIAEHVALALDVVLDDEKRERMLASGLRSPEAYVTFQKGIDLYNEAQWSSRTGPGARRSQCSVPPDARYGAGDSHVPTTSTPIGLFITWSPPGIRRTGELDYPEDEGQEGRAEQLESDLRNAERYAPDAMARNGGCCDAGICYRAVAFTEKPAGGIGRPNALQCELVVLGRRAAFGLTNAASEVYTQMSRACDPLNWVGWQDRRASHDLGSGDTDEAVRLGELGMQHIPVNPVQEALVDAYVAAGRFDDATRFIHTSETDERRAMRLHIFVESARGNGEKARELLDEYFENPGVRSAPLSWVPRAIGRARAC